MSQITLLADPLVNDYGPCRPPILIAQDLQQKGYEVRLISPIITDKVKQILDSFNISYINLSRKVFSKSSSYIWLESWFREVCFHSNGKALRKYCNNQEITINFSGTIFFPSDFFYTMYIFVSKYQINHLPRLQRLEYKLVKPILKWGDKRFEKILSSGTLIGISNHCKELYKEVGFNVTDVIYPPIDLKMFKPSTKKPSRNYILAYYGKEIPLDILIKLADLGVPLKVFGGKINGFIDRENIEWLGNISNEELIDLYTNALYTAFPFTDEFFGYVPLESLACGTPVLTYNHGGPKEIVLDKKTGWLCSPPDFLDTALNIWKHGYDDVTVSNCIKQASNFAMDIIGKKWSKVISEKSY